MSSKWFAMIFPLGVGVWMAIGAAAGLAFLRRNLGPMEWRIIGVLAAGAAILAYSIVYEKLTAAFLGIFGEVGSMVLAVIVLVIGAIMWLRSGAGFSRGR